MSWVLIDDGVPNHPKFLKAGPAASWLWLCGVAYCRRHHTNGLIPTLAVPTLGVDKPRPLITKLVSARLWDIASGEGWRVHDYQVLYGDDVQVKAEKEADRQRKRDDGQRGGKSGAKRPRVARGRDDEASFLEPDGEPNASVADAMVTPSSRGDSKDRDAVASSRNRATVNGSSTYGEFPEAQSSPPQSTPVTTEERRDSGRHPIREFLSLHEQLFEERVGQKPFKYTGKDVKLAERTLQCYGVIGAADLLRAFMSSSDPFIQRAGFGLNVFGSQINKLLAVTTPKPERGDWYGHIPHCLTKQMCTERALREEREKKAAS